MVGIEDKKHEVRKVIYKNEWWFSVTDVVEALTGTDRPRKYWNVLKTKIVKEGYAELSEKIRQLTSKPATGASQAPPKKNCFLFVCW